MWAASDVVKSMKPESSVKSVEICGMSGSPHFECHKVLLASIFHIIIQLCTNRSYIIKRE